MMPPMEMSRESINEYIKKIRERYSRMTGKQARSRLLDEHIAVTHSEHKYAIKVLGNKPRKSQPHRGFGRTLKQHKVRGRRVRPPRGDSAIKAAVEIRAESWDIKEPR